MRGSRGDAGETKPRATAELLGMDRDGGRVARAGGVGPEPRHRRRRGARRPALFPGARLLLDPGPDGARAAVSARPRAGPGALPRLVAGRGRAPRPPHGPP